MKPDKPAAVAVAFAIVASVMLFLTVAAPGPPLAPAPAEAVRLSDPVCPSPPCHGYLDPAKVRGVTVAALQNWLMFGNAMREQIYAIKHAWHGNTVRLQITQDKLVGAGGMTLNRPYLRVVRHMVGAALRQHLNVVINAQTEVTLGYAQNEPLPTEATFQFWRHLNRFYAHNPHVIYDLFNEPRNCVPAGGTYRCGWGRWHTLMQSLIDRLRAAGSRNQLWAEGERWGSTFRHAPLLRGAGIVYVVHHPGCPWERQCPVSTRTWYLNFGYLRTLGLPVVEGEFVNYLGGYYWPHATVTVTQYFRWLHKLGIGMVAWTLQTAIMTVDTDYSTAMAEPQAAGRLIWRYYHGLLNGPVVPVHEHVSRSQQSRYRRDKYHPVH